MLIKENNFWYLKNTIKSTQKELNNMLMLDYLFENWIDF